MKKTRIIGGLVRPAGPNKEVLRFNGEKVQRLTSNGPTPPCPFKKPVKK